MFLPSSLPKNESYNPDVVNENCSWVSCQYHKLVSVAVDLLIKEKIRIYSPRPMFMYSNSG